MRPASRLVVPGYALALTLLVCGPLLAPGYLLLRDAVSTPRSFLSDAALGLTEAAPRAVPQDAAVAWASTLSDGGVVVKALLMLGVWLGGWGAARLAALVLPAASRAGELAAATVAIWNPYVAERLLQGHWSLLVGYGALPWVAIAVLRLRAGGPALPSGCLLVSFIALAGLTPTGVLLAAAVALAATAAPGDGQPRLRCAAGAVAAAAVTAAPWLSAALLGSSLAAHPASGIAEFAARAEPGLATIGSLAGLGGIWNADAVPGTRTTAYALVGTVLLLAVVGCGLPRLWRERAARPLLLLAGVAVVAPALLATGPGRTALEAVVRALPGLGMLRDGQKWVALAMPGYALAAAAATLVLRRRLRPAGAALACCVLPIVALPDLAWGVGGAVAPVRYPAGWSAVAAQINADPRPVLTVPVDSMRVFAWAGPAPVLDPLPRWLRADVRGSGDLLIAGRVVEGEGRDGRRLQRLLLDGAPPDALAEAGIGWIVVERGTPGETGRAAETLRRLPQVYGDGDIALYRVGGYASGVSPSKRQVLIAAHLAWLALLAGGALGYAVARRRVTPGR
ncbi:hypothetical protein LV457_06980 [Mycobacterium sp. MYCO198283]|uniref:hypothetical protein n=1 Tax=Mycobacterium sp. MYCO198283 TaxID=2883505 RepID=UPI001E2A9D0B|nr:hypothetical protein [Mycobacterium sp. MYCO198283]MCG5432034.1 hypothetical protein [Mycobacterium sp. MYCO198283]